MSIVKTYWFPVYFDQGIDPVGYLDIVDNEDSEPEYSFEFHLITDRQFEDVGYTRSFLNKVYAALDYEDAKQLKEIEQEIVWA